MKSLILLITIHLILTEKYDKDLINFDLDQNNTERTANFDFIKPVQEHNIKRYFKLTLEKQFETSSKANTIFTWEENNKNLLAPIPEFGIYSQNGKVYEKAHFNIKVDRSEDFIIANFKEKQYDDNKINCSYSNGHLTQILIKDSYPRINLKKEKLAGNTVYRLTQEGHIEIGMFGVRHFKDLSEFTEAVDFTTTVIKDFFIQDVEDSESILLLLILEKELLHFIVSYSDLKLNFNLVRRVSLVNIPVDKILNIYTRQNGNYIIFTEGEMYVQGRMYILSLDSNDNWTSDFIEGIGSGRSYQAIGKKYDAFAQEFKYMDNEEKTDLYVFILRRYFGLIICILEGKELKEFKIMRHEYFKEFQTSKVFNKNQSIFHFGIVLENSESYDFHDRRFRNEVFVEFGIFIDYLYMKRNKKEKDEEKKIFLSRVYLSRKIIKSAQTDNEGKVTLLLTDNEIFVIPRNVYRTELAPVHVFKGVNKSHESIGLIQVKENVITFRLISNGQEEEIILFTDKEKHFKCAFDKPGDYLVETKTVYRDNHYRYEAIKNKVKQPDTIILREDDFLFNSEKDLEAHEPKVDSPSEKETNKENIKVDNSIIYLS
jgi:hypothetical protein